MFSGWFGHSSVPKDDEGRQKNLQIFKEKYPDIDERTLIRFLKARQYDLTKAGPLLDEDIKWRKETKPESIDPNLIYHEIKKKKAYLHMHTKKGNPIMVIIPGRHNPKEDKAEDCVRTVIYFLEQSLKEIPEGSDGIIFIFDFDGWTFSNYEKKIVEDTVNILLNHYPERMAHVYLLNPPSSFSYVWAVVKWFFPSETREKIQFLGPDFKERLLEHVDPENLQVAYGGTSEYVYLAEDPTDVGLTRSNRKEKETKMAEKHII